MNRRSQKQITIRSDRAAALLKLLTRDGRSQVSVIEEALDRMPDPVLDDGDGVHTAPRGERIVSSEPYE